MLPDSIADEALAAAHDQEVSGAELSSKRAAYYEAH